MIKKLIFETKSDFVPAHTASVYLNRIDESIPKQLCELILREAPNIIKKFPDIEDSENGGPEFLTQRASKYNLFHYDEECVRVLFDFVKASFIDYRKCLNKRPRKTWIHAWGNVIRTGFYISTHNHGSTQFGIAQEYSYVSGNMCLYAENTCTNYVNPFLHKHVISINNVVGDNILFPSYLNHYTDKNPSDISRVSLAYDIITEEQYKLVPDQSLFIPFTE
jgi:hypothetical protein